MKVTSAFVNLQSILNTAQPCRHLLLAGPSLVVLQLVKKTIKSFHSHCTETFPSPPPPPPSPPRPRASLPSPSPPPQPPPSPPCPQQTLAHSALLLSPSLLSSPNSSSAHCLQLYHFFTPHSVSLMKKGQGILFVYCCTSLPDIFLGTLEAFIHERFIS